MPPLGNYYRFLVIFSTLFLCAHHVMATDYTIGNPSGPNDFDSLEELRLSGISWQDGDTITFYGDDNSLTDMIDFDGSNVTLKGYGRITAKTTDAAFANTHWTGTMNVQTNPGTTLEFSGFGDKLNMSGGALYNAGDAMTFGTPGTTGTIGFYDNKGSSGGAVYTMDLEFVDGNYIFSRNSAFQGGAIYSYFQTFTDGNYVFSENSADEGAAIYNSGEVTFMNGDYVFSKNTSRVMGGAIAHWGYDLTFMNGNYTFSENSAEQGGAIFTLSSDFMNGNYTFSDNSAGTYGGAISSSMDLRFHGGNYLFSGNSAGSSGGAIHGMNLELNNGSYTFSRNFAKECGGAIYSLGMNISITDAIFLDNKAARSDPNDMTTGLGGAIYIQSAADVSDPQIFNLKATSGNTVLFQGNLHGYESALTPNSIYFDFGVEDVIPFHTKATFTAEGNGQILMYDPIESKGDSSKISNLNLTKDGTGLWLLGGENNLNSKATVTIAEGTFALYRGASLNLNHATEGHFAVNSGTVFRPTIQENTVSTVNAQSVNLQFGSKLEVTGISTLATGDTTFVDAITSVGTSTNNISTYTPISGNMFQEAKYIAGNGNNLDLAVYGVKNISDVFDVDPFIDIYRKHTLSDDERSMFDEVYYTGVLDDRFFTPEMLEFFALAQGRTILDAMNGRRNDAELFRRLVYDRLNDFEPLIESQDHGCQYLGQSYTDSYKKNGANCGHLWGTFTQNWTEQGGSSYKPFAFTFGRDVQSQQWMFGLAGQYVHGNVRDSGKSITSRVKSDSLDFGVYAGRYGRHWYGKGAFQFGVGWNDADTHYRTTGEHAGGSYNSATLGAGLEFGRNFQLGSTVYPLIITPHVGADYFFLHAGAFDEHGSSSMKRSFGSVNYNVVDLPFGFRVAKTCVTTGDFMNWVRPSVDLAYVRSVADVAPTVKAGYLADPTNSWLASGTKIGRDAFRMNVGLDGRFLNRFDTGLSYQLETRRNFTSHQLNASIAFRW